MDINWNDQLLDQLQWHCTAAEALRQLDDAYSAWTSGVRSLGKDGLLQPCGPSEPYADASMATLVPRG